MTIEELDELCKLSVDEFAERGYSRELLTEVQDYILKNWDSGKFLSEEYGISPDDLTT